MNEIQMSEQEKLAAQQAAQIIAQCEVLTELSHREYSSFDGSTVKDKSDSKAAPDTLRGEPTPEYLDVVKMQRRDQSERMTTPLET